MADEKVLWSGSPNKTAVMVTSIFMFVFLLVLSFASLMLQSDKKYYIFAVLLAFAIIGPIVRYFSLSNKMYTITPSAIVIGNKTLYQFKQVFLKKPIISLFVPVGTIKIDTGGIKITHQNASHSIPFKVKKIYVTLDYLDNAQEVYDLLTKR